MNIDSLKKMIMSYSAKHTDKNCVRRILVIDDLDALLDGSNDDSTSSLLSSEKRAALYAVLESIDEIVQERKSMRNHRIISDNHYDNDDDNNCIPFILGLCRCEPLEIPSILNRIDRFEKIMTMPPPSELQRRAILKHMISQLPISFPNTDMEVDKIMRSEQIIDAWSAILARTTAGCVASDLRRICIDAQTIAKARNSKEVYIGDSITSFYRIEEGDGCVVWDDLTEATRLCTPSQLADLDVTIPKDDFIDYNDLSANANSDKRGTKEWFQECWKHFGGYEEMKSDLYRTLFRPWCRRSYCDINAKVTMSNLEREVPPPSGILFHGDSGTGKTYAVDCLAKSLGLNIIRVRRILLCSILQTLLHIYIHLCN